MAYRLRAHEPPGEGIKRITLEQLHGATGAVEAIGSPRADTGEAIHAARRALKKARAGLRLVRGELDPGDYSRQNLAMRDAARLLAPARDGDVVVETLFGLEPAPPERLVAALERERLGHREVLATDARGDLAEALALIGAAAEAADGWEFVGEDGGALAAGIRRTYGKGLRQFSRAYADGIAETDADVFHELRKRTRYLGHEARILGAVNLEGYGPLRSWSSEAGELLGVDHDLAVLAERIRALGDEATDREDRAEMLMMIAARRLELERRARPVLSQLYADSPSRFTARLAGQFARRREERELRALAG